MVLSRDFLTGEPLSLTSKEVVLRFRYEARILVC